MPPIAVADWSQVTAIGLDETSSRKGRQYFTVFLDATTHHLLFVAEGRSSQAVEAFAKALVAHGGDPNAIGWVAMDMLHCYNKGVREQFAQAKIVDDRYHLTVMAGEAVDEVRRSLQREGALLKGACGAHVATRGTSAQSNSSFVKLLAKQYRPLGRALALRDALQDIYKASDAEGPSSAEVVSLGATLSFKTVPKTGQDHPAILGWDHQFLSTPNYPRRHRSHQWHYPTCQTTARGFRSFIYLRTIAYWVAAKLKLDLPSYLPT